MVLKLFFGFLIYFQNFDIKLSLLTDEFYNIRDNEHKSIKKMKVLTKI